MANAKSNDLRPVKTGAFMLEVKGKVRHLLRQLRRCLEVAALAAAVAGCAGAEKPSKGEVGHIENYFGGIAADEPRAVLVARDVLSAGGTAADAAVAMYFALAVTFPSSAGLGGGGVCMVHGSGKTVVEALDFSARAPAQPAPSDRWVAAVPGGVRGMFALHARYGVLRWANLVQPAERMARFGVPASRALVRKFAGGAERLRADTESWRIFRGAGGTGPVEGELLRQLGLAGLLGRIRTRGAGDFYNGETARNIVAGVQAAGGVLAIEDLRGYHPAWIPVLVGSYENHDIVFPGAPIAGGQIAHALWRGLDDGKSFAAASGADRQRIIAQAAIAIYKDVETRVATNFGATGFVVIDRDGGAVACSLSMNGLFGNGRMIRGTGMLAAPPPRPGPAGSAGVAPALMINRHTGQVFMAAVASANAAAPLALVSTVLSALTAGVPLEKALETVRVRPGARAGSVLVESNASEALKSALAAGGFRVDQAETIGRVNIMYCPDGMQNAPAGCDVQTDRRGHGYAINAEF